MAKYKVTYRSPSAGSEEVEADGFVDNGDWLDFQDVHMETTLRIIASEVKRIERIGPG